MMTKDAPIYDESVFSRKTTALFVSLAILFLMLLVWRVNAARLDFLAGVFGFLLALFLFYSVNYRTLNIRLTSHSLMLTFGLFTWTVPLENIEACCFDDLPFLLRIGGAGIHFMVVDRRYRASFNFLEHPRIVIALRMKAGLVRDISFSTCQPDQVLRLIREAVAARAAH